MQRSAVRRAMWVLRQFLIVALGIVVYFGARGLTVGKPSTAIDHAHDVIAFEALFNLDQEQAVQDLLIGRDWLTDIANWIYIWGHWPVITVVMVWLALRHGEVFLRLRNAMIASGGVGLIIFASYPVSPPRLTGLGLIDTVTERSGAYRVLQPPAFVNQYAAMPSLHVGWDLLVGLAVASAASGALLRWIGRLMPLLMAGAVVLTANHYFVDGIAGAALALAGLAFAIRLERWQERRRVQQAPPPATDRPAVHDHVPTARIAPETLPARRGTLVD